MQVSADVRINEGQQRFMTGDLVSGYADVNLPADVPTSSVKLAYNCVGEVKWTEYPGTPYYQNGYEFFDRFTYYEEEMKVKPEEGVKVEPFLDHKKLCIQFSFKIPKDKNLPSTMSSAHGFIQHFIRVTVKDKEGAEKHFMKEFQVIAPIEKDLMITVGGQAEKTVILHGGKVSMNASIGRKGFAPGETVDVHVTIDNKTNTTVVPKAALNQVQIFMCGVRHKTIETTIPEQQDECATQCDTPGQPGCFPCTNSPVVGAEVAPHSSAEQVLNVKIPWDESLSIKSSVITVKYFVHVLLDIPHSFNLHVNLPIVVTSGNVLDAIEAGKKYTASGLVQTDLNSSSGIP